MWKNEWLKKNFQVNILANSQVVAEKKTNIY